MLPDWFTKPESLFRTALWLLGPFLTFFIGRVILRRYDAWESALSEKNARATLGYLYRALDNPPTLLESVALIVCFLPIPFCIAALGLVLYIGPRPHWMPSIQWDPNVQHQIHVAIATVASFCCYLLFGALTVHGIRTAYRLRHGQAGYHANYRAGIQKKIDKLLKKFPQLRNVPTDSARPC
jgi:hypothetical protein